MSLYQTRQEGAVSSVRWPRLLINNVSIGCVHMSAGRVHSAACDWVIKLSFHFRRTVVEPEAFHLGA